MSRIIKIRLLVIVLALLSVRALCQQPLLTENFEKKDTGIYTVKGIAGMALDLGPAAANRQMLIKQNPLKKNDKAFSVTIWVKGDLNAEEPYDLLSCMQKTDSGYNGWKISMTARGAWSFRMKKGNNEYDYTTTAPRQSIRNGLWHLLAVTYSATGNELRFFYDGRTMAIYRADGIEGFYDPEKIVIGGSIDNEHYSEPAFGGNSWDVFNGEIDDLAIYNQLLTEKDIAGYYMRTTGKQLTDELVYLPGTFKVTSFNIYHGAHEFGKEVGKNRLVEILRQTNADAFCLIETYGSGPEIADALGYHLYLISSNLSILSKYPITETYRLTESFMSGGAQLMLPGNKKLNLFCTWIDWRPAFHSNGFTNGEGWSLDKYMQEENNGRGANIRMILKDIEPYIKQKDNIPIIVAGDFNSGSHLDWTEKAKSIHKGYVIPWPASTAMVNAGFKDSYREIYPDPLTHPGETFSDHYKMWIKARIDYIYYQGKALKATASKVIDKDPVTFPSDHAAMTTLFHLDE